MRRVTEKHHGDRLGDVDEAACNFPAVALLAAWSTLSAVVWSKCRWCRLQKVSRLCCVAAEDCAGVTREIGRPEVHEDRVVCACVSLGEAQLVVEECVDPVCADAPVERSAWHAWKSRAVRIAPSRPPAPQSGVVPGALNSGSLNMSATVPLAAM